MLACTLLLSGINARRTTGEESPYWGRSAQSFSQGWQDEQGDAVDPGQLNVEKDHPRSEWYEIHAELPQVLPADATLSFRSLYLRFTVIIGEHEIYSYGMEHPMYSAIPPALAGTIFPCPVPMQGRR